MALTLATLFASEDNNNFYGMATSVESIQPEPQFHSQQQQQQHDHHQQRCNSLTVCTPDILKLVEHGDQPKQQFPVILHRLIDETDDSIVSWNPNGAAFKIHDRDMFMTVVPRYFKLSKFRSFTRQLNMWSFSHFSTGPNKGQYWHPKFVRGMYSLCLDMTREKSKKNTTKSAERRSAAVQESRQKTSPATAEPTSLLSTFNDDTSHAPLLSASSMNVASIDFDFNFDPLHTNNNDDNTIVQPAVPRGNRNTQVAETAEDRMFAALFKHLETRPLNDLATMGSSTLEEMASRTRYPSN